MGKSQNPERVGSGKRLFSRRHQQRDRSTIPHVHTDPHEEAAKKAGAEKGKVARIALNWPQAVLRLEYVEDGQENVTMEEANEGEKE